MKKILCSLIAVLGLTTVTFAYNYDTNLPLPGKSIADTTLQNFAIVDTEVTEARIDNKWQELWTIKACSKTAIVPINFELKESGGTYAIDPMGVKVKVNE